MIKHTKITEFKKELLQLLEKYQFSISHEDCHGGFILELFDNKTNDWFFDFTIDWEVREQLEREEK